MNNNILTVELLKRIFGNIGAIPDNFGMAGITADDFIIKNKIKFLNDENKIEEYNIYVGEIQHGYKIALTNIGQLDAPEYISILLPAKTTNFAPIGFKLAWLDNTGAFVQKQGAEWISISMLYKLNLAAAIELITDDGQVWMPAMETDEVYELLFSLVQE